MGPDWRMTLKVRNYLSAVTIYNGRLNMQKKGVYTISNDRIGGKTLINMGPEWHLNLKLHVFYNFPRMNLVPTMRLITGSV